MGIEAALIGLAVGQGISGFSEGEKQAKLKEQETRERADLRADEVRRQLAKNTALFAKSGVDLSGSPLFSLEAGARAGAADVASITRSGYRQAGAMRAQGRQALMSGLTQGALVGASGGFGSGNAGFDFQNIGTSLKTNTSLSDLAGAF